LLFYGCAEEEENILVKARSHLRSSAFLIDVLIKIRYLLLFDNNESFSGKKMRSKNI